MKNYYKLFKPVIIFMMIAVFSSQLWAQDNTGTNTINMGIPELQLLATTNPNIDLELTTTTAGEAIQSGAQDSSYVQISSIVSTAGAVRTITAETDAIPAGTVLSLTVIAPSGGNEGGTIGQGIENVELSTTTAKDIASGIGSCYTGTEATDGYKLVYSWSAGTANYGDIVATTGTVATVTLTLTDDI